MVLYNSDGGNGRTTIVDLLFLNAIFSFWFFGFRLHFAIASQRKQKSFNTNQPNS